jgi:hypothetical protein
VGLLQVRIVILQAFVDLETTGLVELESDLVEDVHVEVNTRCVALFSQILLELDHHLLPDAALAIRL